MRILFIGDVVGAAGMTAVKSMLPDAISRWEVDLAVVNGENSAGTGFGITEGTYQGIRGAGADVVTLGNHSWNRKEALSFIGGREHDCRQISGLTRDRRNGGLAYKRTRRQQKEILLKQGCTFFKGNAKHRYVYFAGDKGKKLELTTALRLQQLPYRKRQRQDKAA